LPRDVGVVIVAAGLGTRLGGGVPKQFRPLGGVPMLLRALQPFTTHPEVAHTVVVLPPADAAAPPAWLAAVLGGDLALAAGGAERSDSVARGLAALPGSCATVLVHDAARPFVDQAIISAVVAAAREGCGALPGIPVGDTLKETDAALRVTRTIPRDRLYRAQTPQGFPRAVLEQAHAHARREGSPATDDALLVERLGVPVRVVPGSARNFKITTEDDLWIAERLL
jgi:2-C-methyl-D-erythritol 4-phosphate cytidylyltransferase